MLHLDFQNARLVVHQGRYWVVSPRSVGTELLDELVELDSVLLLALDKVDLPL